MSLEITDKIRARARHLASHSAGDGVEAELAKARLEVLIEKHPGLTYLMDKDAMEYDTVYVLVTTPTHEDLLIRLGVARECVVEAVPVFAHPEPHEISFAHWTVSGKRADIRATLDAYAEHGDALTALFDQLGRMYLSTLNEESKAADELARLITDLLSNPPEPTLLEKHLEARQAHTDTLVERMPRLAIGTLCLKLVRLSDVLRRPPSLLLGERTIVWNDPDLSWADFKAAHASLLPNSSIEETTLAFLFRDGYRLYPLTRRLRLCQELARDPDWTPEDW